MNENKIGLQMWKAELKRLTALRNAKGWTNNELARQSGVHHSAVYRTFDHGKIPQMINYFAMRYALEN